MGPTMIKIGQVLSGRPDVVGVNLSLKLGRLAQDCKPAVIDSIEGLVADSLGVPFHSVFSSVAPTPIAVGSIAQVHPARLTDGNQVCLKLKKPGVAARLRRDLLVLRALARGCAKIQLLRNFGLGNMLIELIESIEAQLDFDAEARALEDARQYFKSNEAVLIPDVYSKLTSDDAIVMEYCDELVSISDVSSPAERRTLAVNTLKAFYALLFDKGIVHADLHAGNVFTNSRGALVLLDFGLCARLTRHAGDCFRKLFWCFSVGDGFGVADALLAASPSQTSSELKRGEFRARVARIVSNAEGAKAAEFEVVRFVRDLMSAMRSYELSPSRDFTMALVGLVSLEGILRRFAPDVDFQAIAAAELLFCSTPPMTVAERRSIYRELVQTVGSPF